jgi:acetyl-CoA carboxylase carboxyltransferase component
MARARLLALFDEGTFEEVGAAVRHRATDFGLDKRTIPGDGVVTGFGEVDGRTVYAYAQERTALGGSLGEEHARKIARLQDQALQAGCPFVGMNDSGGARIQEGVDSLGGYGEIFRRNVRSSGIIPQISLILGPCAGGAVYSPALTDFVGMVDRQSYMFLTGPKVVKTVTFEDVTTEELGGGAIHSTKTGVSSFLFKDEAEAIATVRRILSYLPSNCHEKPPVVECDDPVDRMPHDLEDIVPQNPRLPYDVRKVVEQIVDLGSLLEVHEKWARNIVVGFARLDGNSVGVVANQPLEFAGVLDIDASRKAARFIRTCNAFGVPIVSFVDVPGFLPGVEQEMGAVIDHGAKLLYAYCEATVPKLSVILRKAYGGAYIVMSSKHVGGDCNLAWPTAEIAVMGSKGAVEILHSKELHAADDPEAVRAKREGEYKEMFLSPDRAAARGYIDEVIAPCETRRKLIRNLRALRNKTEHWPARRNSNMPT